MPIHVAPPGAKRALMVWEQLVRRGIQDQRVLEALGKLPREEFVPPERAGEAYEDKALPIGHHQTISQPYIVGLTLEALELDEDHRVLEVGTGSGYAAALLGELAREVISVEVVEELARLARERLSRLGCANVKVVAGDGSKGYPAAAPYDRIVVSAAGPQIPPSLVDQLDEGGVLVMPVGDRRHQMLRRARRRRGQLIVDDLCSCVYVPLIGEEGWGETDPGAWPEPEEA